MADAATTKEQKRLHDYWARQVTTQTRKRSRAEEEAEQERERLYEAMLDAQEIGGVTYDELAEITGLARSRVGQVLDRQRTRRAKTKEATA